MYPKRTNQLALVDALAGHQPSRHEKKAVRFSLRKKLGAAIDKFRKEQLSLLMGETRRRQMEEIGSSKQEFEISEAERKLNRNLRISSIMLGPTLLSLVFPQLTILLLPGLIYVFLPFYQLVYKTFRDEHRISSYLLEVLLVTGMMVGGYFRAAVVGSWLATWGRKMFACKRGQCQEKSIKSFWRTTTLCLGACGRCGG